MYRPSWYGMYIATPAWKQFMNTYLAAINAPIDNDYGKGADKYTVSKGATRTYNQYQYQRQQNSQQQSQQQTNQASSSNRSNSLLSSKVTSSSINSCDCRLFMPTVRID
mgnify:CR=1 FL=1